MFRGRMLAPYCTKISSLKEGGKNFTKGKSIQVPGVEPSSLPSIIYTKL
jgi:hypothetical protein